MQVDLQKNPKQAEFFFEALKAVSGNSEIRHLFYGGAIRGGKSFVCAGILLFLASRYKNTRWHVFRATFPEIEKTILPTFEKITAGSRQWKWNRSSGNYFMVNLVTGSRIFFVAENISHDPNLDALLGLETNGIFYEQIEGLSQKLWEIGNSRNGSWYVDNMPKPITLATFNPTQSWIKNKIHIPFLKGELPPEYHYKLALPTDNAFVTQEQYQNWDRLDERYKRQFIQGDWTNFDDNGALWAYAYNPSKHLGKVELDKTKEIKLSFDFNKNPMCCSVIQTYGFSKIRFVETIKLPNSDIYDMCNYIKATYGNRLFIVTGDASGNNLSAMVKDNLTYYKIIQQQLNLSIHQLIVPTVNPRIEDNRILFNSVLSRGDLLMDEHKTKALQFDLENAKVLPDGTLKKMDRTDPTQQLDALDTARYAVNTFMPTFAET